MPTIEIRDAMGFRQLSVFWAEGYEGGIVRCSNAYYKDGTKAGASDLYDVPQGKTAIETAENILHVCATKPPRVL
jgi:hypothetical protein